MVLDVTDLSVRFGDFVAVDHVSLGVSQGEILGLLGPSGCGKSTLLRAVAGLAALSSGSVTWSGQDMRTVPVHRREFGFVFQDGQLFGHLSVARNVAYGLARSISRVERERRVEELLELVGLAGYGTRNVTTLSGGEKQRVALARALAPHPRLLLLDEPLSALDRELRERLAVDVRSILHATGTTAIFVTHDQDEAFTVCDRVAVMRAGKIVQIDAPERLWRHPSSREIAEFLGYEVVVREQPFEGYAPCDFEVVETYPADEAMALADRFGQRGGPGASEQHAGTSSHAPTGPTEYAGIVADRFFQSGRAVARIDVPGVGTLTVLADAVRLEPGQGVRIIRVNR